MERRHRFRRWDEEGGRGRLAGALEGDWLSLGAGPDVGRDEKKPAEGQGQNAGEAHRAIPPPAGRLALEQLGDDQPVGSLGLVSPRELEFELLGPRLDQQLIGGPERTSALVDTANGRDFAEGDGGEGLAVTHEGLS